MYGTIIKEHLGFFILKSVVVITVIHGFISVFNEQRLFLLSKMYETHLHKKKYHRITENLDIGIITKNVNQLDYVN